MYAATLDERDIILKKQLGQGRYGTVWAGECFTKPVAVKIISQELLAVPALQFQQIQLLRKEIYVMT